MKQAWVTVGSSLLLAIASVQAGDIMQAFPAAESGMSRYVLHLPAQDDESRYQIELQIGKMVRTDARNRYFFAGRIEKETIKGWGYTRYTLKKLGPMAGTLMAVDPNEPKVDRFITLGGEPYLIRYNSKVPVVVYVPAGVEVRYRIWTAGAEMRTMEMG